MPKIGSKYTESYYSRFGINKTAEQTKSEGIIVGTNELLLKRIIENYGIDYESLKREYIERIRKGITRLDRSLCVDGIGSAYIIFEKNIATIVYGDGRNKKFTISLT